MVGIAVDEKNDCPLKNNCLTSSVVYSANVTTESDAIGKNYIGLTEGTFKQRYTQHKLSCRSSNYSNRTELLRVTDSKYRESLDRFEKSKTLKLCLKLSLIHI